MRIAGLRQEAADRSGSGPFMAAIAMIWLVLAPVTLFAAHTILTAFGSAAAASWLTGALAYLCLMWFALSRI
jgi:hypothetical protein